MDDDIEFIETPELPSLDWSWPEFGFNAFTCISEAIHCVGMFFHEVAVQFGRMHNRHVDVHDSRDFAGSVMSAIARMDEE
jgi:hypothetical protein